MLTLEEAIKRCKEKTEELKERVEQLKHFEEAKDEISYCLECAAEHEQLAKWLIELQDWRNRQSQLEFERRIAWAVTNITPDEITFQGKRYILKEEKC